MSELTPPPLVTKDVSNWKWKEWFSNLFNCFQSVDDRVTTLEGAGGGGGGDFAYKEFKTSIETLQSSTTLQDDDELIITDVASGTYALEMLVFYAAETNANFKFDFDNSANVTSFNANYFKFNNASSVVNPTEIINVSSDYTSDGNGEDERVMLIINGTFVTSGSGELGFRWSQDTSQATDCSVYAGSWMRLSTVE